WQAGAAGRPARAQPFGAPHHRPLRRAARRGGGRRLTLPRPECLRARLSHQREPMAVAFVFPGQGSQAVGMGKALAETFPAAKAVFEDVDEALGEKLSAVMWEGPAERLTLTENAQPALMAVSLATLAVLRQEAGVEIARDAAFVAGHSLGEYSALAAAGSFAVAEAARLLRIRGRAMQQAVPVGSGAMAALLGLDFEAVAKIALEAARGQGCPAAHGKRRR